MGCSREEGRRKGRKKGSGGNLRNPAARSSRVRTIDQSKRNFGPDSTGGKAIIRKLRKRCNEEKADLKDLGGELRPNENINPHTETNKANVLAATLGGDGDRKAQGKPTEETKRNLAGGGHHKHIKSQAQPSLGKPTERR